MEKALYTLVEASKELGRSKKAMHRLVQRERIGYHQEEKGKPIYFSRHQLDAFLKSTEVLAKNPKKGGFSMKTLRCEETSSGSNYWIIFGFGWVYSKGKQRPDKNGKRFPSWYIRFYEGKKRISQKAKGAKTFEEAIRILVETISNQRQRTDSISDDGLKKITLSEFWEERKDNVSMDTVKAYKYSIIQFIPENTLLSAIGVETVKNYINWMKSRKNSLVTINKRLQCLRKILDEAEDLDCKLNMNKNPVRKSLFQNVEKKEESDTPIITPEQQEILFPLLVTHVRIAAIISCLTGMRKSEVKDLKWDDITLNGKGKSWIQLLGEKTKTRKGRTIPFTVSPGLHELFVDLKKQNEAIKDSEFRNKSDRQFVILSNRSGKWIHPTTINKYWNRAIEKAKLKGTGIKFHSLRHTFITEKENANMNPVVLNKITGHSSLKMTSYYTHLKPEELCEIVEK